MMDIKSLIKEEIMSVLEVSMTKKFTIAVEALQKVQLQQQKIRKAFVKESDPKKKEKLKDSLIKYHKIVQKAEANFNDAVKGEPIDMDESINEDVFKSFLADDPAFKVYTATNTENRKTVSARSTKKTWDDGVPVLKYIARASKKASPLPKGKFKIIEDNKHGWWYYLSGGTWYGIQQKDYGTPPFEY
tara:strand:+ start:5404 stop:5967 length:564 start_codon:yes stop_codon:yes gene_type:complete